jgi:lycopene cyclase domain-containing protein
VTYADLAVMFVLGSMVVAAVCHLIARPSLRWRLGVLLVALVLVVLTAVFDSVMIAADLFRFDEDMLLGVRVGLAPLEDFAWPIAAVLLLPALWEALGRRRGRQGVASPAGRAGELLAGRPVEDPR